MRFEGNPRTVTQVSVPSLLSLQPDTHTELDAWPFQCAITHVSDVKTEPNTTIILLNKIKTFTRSRSESTASLADKRLLFKLKRVEGEQNCSEICIDATEM